MSEQRPDKPKLCYDESTDLAAAFDLIDQGNAEIERLTRALDRVRREAAAQTNGRTHYEGCATHHPWCRVLAYVQEGLRLSPPYCPLEMPPDSASDG